MPLTPLPSLTTALAHTVAASMLIGAAGWGAMGDTSPLLGAAVGAAALGWLLHTLRSLHRRVQQALAQSTEALQQLGRGHSAFHLDGQGLREFDPLLLAIDDLREAVEPARTAPRPSGRSQTARVHAGIGTSRPAWLNG